MADLTGGCVPGCGRCCDPVWLSVSPPEQDYVRALRAIYPDREEPPNTRWWLDDLTPTGMTSDAGYAYECRHFDVDARLCTAHEQRPPACRGWPFYEGHDDVESNPSLPDVCGFQWSLPVEQRGPLAHRLIPVEVLRAEA